MCICIHVYRHPLVAVLYITVSIVRHIRIISHIINYLKFSNFTNLNQLPNSIEY